MSTYAEREMKLARVIRVHATVAKRYSRWNRVDLPTRDGRGLAATMERIRAVTR